MYNNSINNSFSSQHGAGSIYGGSTYSSYYGSPNSPVVADRADVNFGGNLTPVNWDNVSKVAATFQYYTPRPDVSPRSSEEVSVWMNENAITCYGDNSHQPILSFDELVAPESVHEAFRQSGFVKPSVIQAAAWSIILQSRDFVGIAKTGSGKTLAFMVPAVLHILSQPPLRAGDGPLCLVLAPTRELAVQIEQESQKLTSKIPTIRSVCIYGGAPKWEQKKTLRCGVHVIIATPGRLIDMLSCNATNLLRVTYLVLDEADRMLDMGFEPQIRQICSQIRADRQTLMFSATWPQEIRNLAASFQKNFVRINIGSEELLANADVTQHFAILKDDEKEPKLLEILGTLPRQRVLIFTKTKRMADILYRTLRRSMPLINALVIHGDKDQPTRDRAIEVFKRDARACLVATDVAARGLDIRELDVVINYDFPTNVEDYVHRIGRTGRAGRKGDAFTFFTADEPAKTVRALCDLLRRAHQIVPQELLDLSRGSGGRDRRGAHGGRWGVNAGNARGHMGSNNGFNNNNTSYGGCGRGVSFSCGAGGDAYGMPMPPMLGIGSGLGMASLHATGTYNNSNNAGAQSTFNVQGTRTTFTN